MYPIARWVSTSLVDGGAGADYLHGDEGDNALYSGGDGTRDIVLGGPGIDWCFSDQFDVGHHLRGPRRVEDHLWMHPVDPGELANELLHLL